ncbi:MAG: hypothetical protein ACLGXA_22385 [Acidobacteriota bacterium]
MDDFRKPEPKDTPGQESAESRDAGSATGIFGRPTAPAHSAGEDDLLASLLRQSAGPQSAAPVPPASPSAPSAAESPTSVFVAPAANPSTPASGAFSKPASPGEVTRILQRVKPAGEKQDLAGIFRQVSIEKTPANEPAPPAAVPPGSAEPRAESSPGSFTQAFRDLAAKSAANPGAGPAANASAPPAVAAMPQSAGPGEFTRLFQAVQSPSQQSSTRTDAPLVQAPPPVPAPPPQTAAGSPESLTQLFAKSAPAAEAPGSLWTPAPTRDASFPSAPAKQEEPLPAQGGFTQLFQALNQGPAAPAKPADLPPPAPTPSGPAGQVGFTQLLETLSTKGAPAPAPSPLTAAPPAAAAPVLPPSGEGEFTRVISASALRESQARLPAAPSPAPVAAAPAAPPAARPPMPAGMPPMPHFQMPGMAAPHAAAPAAAAPHALFPMAPPAFQFPPAAPPPPPAAPAPQAGGLQKYLPLILTVNIFLMLAILLVLFVVLRHR